MGKSDPKALTDMGLDELDIVTTSGAATTDYVLVIADNVPKKILISDLDKLIT